MLLRKLISAIAQPAGITIYNARLIPSPSIEQEFSSLQCSSTAGIGYKILIAGKIVKIVISLQLD